MSINNKLEVYGDDFQLSLIKCFIEDPSFYRGIKDNIESHLFTSIEARNIYESINEFYKQYNRTPSYELLESLIKGKYANDNNPTIKNICLKCIQLLKNKNKKEDQVVKDKTIYFLQLREFESFVNEGVEFLKYYNDHDTAVPDFDKLKSKFQTIQKISADRIDSDLLENISQVLSNKEIKSNVVPIRHELMNYLFDGGFGGGESIVRAAFTNVGKTNSAISDGAEAFKMGKTVAHFTFENIHDVVAKFYAASISGIPIREVTKYSKYVKNKIIEKYSEECGGKLHIKHYPVQKYGLSKIESYYEKLMDDGIEPDLIIIDSPLHLKPPTVSDNKKYNVAQVFAGVKGFAQGINKPIISTAQLNRTSASEELIESDKVGLEQIGDAIEIMQDADIVIVMTRSQKKRLENKVRIKIAKNRTNRSDINFDMYATQQLCHYEEVRETTQPLLEAMKRQDEESFQKTDELLKSLNLV